MANAFCFNLSMEVKKAGSILVLNVQVNVENTSAIIVQKIQAETLLSTLQMTWIFFVVVTGVYSNNSCLND